MAHYAKIENGIVTQVIVAEQDYIDTIDGTWVQTSFNTKRGKHYEADGITESADQSRALRKNFAKIGGTYDSVRDAFLSPKPFESWVIDEDTCTFVKPLISGSEYCYWDEENTTWVACQPPNVELSRFRFMLNLKGITLADSSNAYTTAESKSTNNTFASERIKTLYDHATVFKRLNSDVLAFANDLGLTGSQLDTIFEIGDSNSTQPGNYNNADTTRPDD